MRDVKKPFLAAGIIAILFLLAACTKEEIAATATPVPGLTSTPPPSPTGGTIITSTPSPAPTGGAITTPTPTFTPTATSTFTPTPTATLTPTATFTPTPTFTPTFTPTATATFTPTPTPTPLLETVIPLVRDSVVKVVSGSKQISGMVLKEPASHVLTSSKDLGTGPLVTIQTGAGQSYNGWIVGRDDNQNLALIKVVGATLPGIAFGDDLALESGSEVLTLGYTLAAEGKLFTAPARLAAVQQDLNTGLRFLRLDVPHRTGITGGPAVNRQGQAMGISADPLFVQSLGVSVSAGAYILSADSILQILPLLRVGVQTIARPTPTPNPSAPPPSFNVFTGIVTINGAAPSAGKRLYARIINSVLGDVWAPPKGEELKSDGTYALTVAAQAEFYKGATVEFYIEGVKANETGVFGLTQFPSLNLTFSQ